MANHKRGRPKNRRAGCLACKPHKANGFKGGQAARTLQDLHHDLPAAVADAEAENEYTWDEAHYDWSMEDRGVDLPRTLSFTSAAELARAGRTVRCPAVQHTHGVSYNGEPISLCPLCEGEMRVTVEEAGAYHLAGMPAVHELREAS